LPILEIWTQHVYRQKLAVLLACGEQPLIALGLKSVVLALTLCCACRATLPACSARVRGRVSAPHVPLPGAHAARLHMAVRVCLQTLTSDPPWPLSLSVSASLLSVFTRPRWLLFAAASALIWVKGALENCRGCVPRHRQKLLMVHNVSLRLQPLHLPPL